MQEKSTQVCQQCGKPLRGRTDKKFCDDLCRNAYNNRLKSKNNLQIKTINGTLIKNRRIMEAILPDTDDTVKIHRERLLKQGFQFTYHTHLYTTKNGKIYTYCYDYGYLPLDNDWYLIVRKREE